MKGQNNVNVPIRWYYSFHWANPIIWMWFYDIDSIAKVYRYRTLQSNPLNIESVGRNSLLFNIADILKGIHTYAPLLLVHKEAHFQMKKIVEISHHLKVDTHEVVSGASGPLLLHEWNRNNTCTLLD